MVNQGQGHDHFKGDFIFLTIVCYFCVKSAFCRRVCEGLKNVFLINERDLGLPQIIHDLGRLFLGKQRSRSWIIWEHYGNPMFMNA